MDDLWLTISFAIFLFLSLVCLELQKDGNNVYCQDNLLKELCASVVVKIKMLFIHIIFNNASLMKCM